MSDPQTRLPRNTTPEPDNVLADEIDILDDFDYKPVRVLPEFDEDDLALDDILEF